jgi:large subunit ribosomal protein L9
MEVILLERVKNLGEMGAIVSVKPGYARNFLVPKSKALRATSENKKLFDARRAEMQVESADKLVKAQSVHAVVDKNFIVVIRQSGEDGRLFGSVSTRDIAGMINDKFNQEISHSRVVLDSPVKHIGVHEVNIHLHCDLNAVIYLNIARTENEAEESRKAFLTPPKKLEAE